MLPAIGSWWKSARQHRPQNYGDFFVTLQWLAQSYDYGRGLFPSQLLRAIETHKTYETTSQIRQWKLLLQHLVTSKLKDTHEDWAGNHFYTQNYGCSF